MLVLLVTLPMMVCGDILFDRFLIAENHTYLNTNVSIDTNATHSFLGMDTYVHVNMNPKITIRVDFSRIQKNKRLKLFSTPKIFFCDVLDNAKMIPFFELLLHEIAKYGTLPMACPIKADYYYMRGLSLDVPYPGQKNVPYVAVFTGADDEKKPPAFVLKFEVFFRWR